MLSNSCLVLPAVVKQEQKEISRNHVPSFFAVSVLSGRCFLVSLRPANSLRSSGWSAREIMGLGFFRAFPRGPVAQNRRAGDFVFVEKSRGIEPGACGGRGGGGQYADRRDDAVTDRSKTDPGHDGHARVGGLDLRPGTCWPLVVYFATTVTESEVLRHLRRKLLICFSLGSYFISSLFWNDDSDTNLNVGFLSGAQSSNVVSQHRHARCDLTRRRARRARPSHTHRLLPARVKRQRGQVCQVSHEAHITRGAAAAAD